MFIFVTAPQMLSIVNHSIITILPNPHPHKKTKEKNSKLNIRSSLNLKWTLKGGISQNNPQWKGNGGNKTKRVEIAIK